MTPKTATRKDAAQTSDEAGPTTDVHNTRARESYKKTVSRKTVVNVLGTLSTILTTARNWGYNCEQINLDKLRLPARGDEV